MEKISTFVKRHKTGMYVAILGLCAFLLVPVSAHAVTAVNGDLSVNLGWTIPSLGGILTFIIRLFFVVAGLAALFFLLLGALAWVTSGGSKDAVEGAQKKIIAAVVGVVLIVVVLSVIVTLEQIVFQCAICFGLSCEVTIPSILSPAGTNVGTTGCQ